ncbi:MAG: PLP-dependent aminotransferase family protein [Streptosporangiaceae bacterium]
MNLDRSAGLREGIERALRDAIRDGLLGLGTALPSSRALAHDLGVARGTVSSAYSQLSAEGYLNIRQGAPVRVRWQARPSGEAASMRVPHVQYRWDLRPGRPDSSSFPRLAWAKAVRVVLVSEPDQAFGYGDPCGSPKLRQVLADYLGRVRGVETSAGHLITCSGFTQALTLICRVLQPSGNPRLAVEDPSAPRYRRLAEAHGVDVVPVPCDRDGLQVDFLARSGAAAALVTPAHQYPTGVRMSADRRAEIVEWARRRDALVIEDDYDGEFQYDREPAGALQRLDPERVIYAGTASKALAPGLRLGWIAVPRHMYATVAAARADIDRGADIVTQLALAEFILSGAYDRHVRKMRNIYQWRRRELQTVMMQVRDDLRLAGAAAGLQALLYLPPGLTERHVKSYAERASIGVHCQSTYWHHCPDSCRQAILIGYGTPADHAYRPSLDALAGLLTQLT